MLKFIIAGLLILIFIPSSASASKLSNGNKMAVTIYAKKYVGGKGGEQALRGMLRVESMNGKYKVGQLDPSFGIGQMKVKTARAMGRVYKLDLPQSDILLIHRLLTDDLFAIELSAMYLGYLYRLFKHMELAIAAYNKGERWVLNELKEGRMINTDYVVKVRRAIMEELK